MPNVKIPNLCSATFPPKSAVSTISLPGVPVLAEMEYHGIRVDREYLATLDEKLGEIITKAERELSILAGGTELKLNSAASVANLLFNVGYIDPDSGKRVLHEPVSRTPTGQAQTTDKVLKALVAKSGCKFSAKKLIYAKAYKAKNTFVANVRDLSSLDGYLHTNYNQHGTATYRLSCVAGDTLLQTSAGGVRIADLDLAANPDITVLTHALRQKPILDKIYKGEDEMFEVELDDGRTIKCTADHKFLTPTGWKRLGALREEDEILCVDSDPPA